MMVMIMMMIIISIMMIIIMLGWFESNWWLDLNYFEFVVTTDHF